MVHIILQRSLLQRFCTSGLLTAAWLATLSLDSAAGFKLLLVLSLAVQSGLMLVRRVSSRLHLFFSSASYERLFLGSQFCCLESEDCSRRFQHPKILYYSECLIILRFTLLPAEFNLDRHSVLRRWLGNHCLILTPDSLSSEHDWRLRRHLQFLYGE